MYSFEGSEEDIYMYSKNELHPLSQLRHLLSQNRGHKPYAAWLATVVRAGIRVAGENQSCL